MRRTPRDPNPCRTLARFRLLLTGSALLLLGAAVFLASAQPAAAARRGADYYPNVPLINQDGETLHFYDDVIKGKVVAINFMFTSCGDACPLETAKLVQVQRLLGDHIGKNVFMYSITVDPERDTPPVLKAYMEKYKVGPGWQFLTGKKEDIDRIRDKLGMLNDDEQELSDHNINFILGNEATGRWLKRTPFDLPQTTVAVLLGRLQKRPLLTSADRPSYANTRVLAAARPGEDEFNARCAACHTIGRGDKLGPDLLGVADIRDRIWLIRWLKEPDVMLQEKDPLAMALYKKYNNVPMPNLQLDHRTILDLIQFMQDETRRVRAQAMGAPPQTKGPAGAAKAGPAGRPGATQDTGNSTAEDQARADAAPAKAVP